MSGCRLCDFTLVEKGEGDDPDYLEGERESDGNATLVLFKCDKPGLVVQASDDWDTKVDYRIGDVRGVASVPTGYDFWASFEVRYCPRCGREL